MTHDKRRTRSPIDGVPPRFDIHHPEWNSNFFWRTLNACNAAVLVINRAFELVYCNEYTSKVLTGIPIEDFVGRSLTQFRTLPDEEMEKVAAHMAEVFEHGRPSDVENWAIHRDGTRRRVFWSSLPLFDADGNVSHLVAVGWDITRQHDVETRLKSLAHFDGLTGLYNRSSFMELLRAELHERTAERGLALLFIDLDGFKEVNDRHGHEAGDEILREVAARLRQTLRQNDIVGRLGGDEFTVLLRDIGRPDAVMIVEKLLQVFRMPYPSGSTQRGVGASVGISLFPDDGTDAQTLLNRADAAMYLAKGAGKNCFRFRDDSDSALAAAADR